MTAAETVRFTGIGASPGFAVGHVFLITHEAHTIPRRTLKPDEVAAEIERFDNAVSVSLNQMDNLLGRMKEAATGGILIVEAHRMMLQDELLVGRTHETIRTELLNAEAALERTLKELEEAFAKLSVSYFKERGGESRFVGQRIMSNLMGQYRPPSSRIPAGAIVVAHELSPSDTLELTARRIGGFVTEVGGAASHTSIMARAMEIPAVIGAHGTVRAVANEQSIVIDGNHGVVIVNPDKETIRKFHESRRRHQVRQAQLLANRDSPAITTDGVRLRLEGNIEYVAEIESLLSHGGEGIGLFRTEYLFMLGLSPPDEATQLAEYRRIVEEVAPYSATIRTLDVGGDKIAGNVLGREVAENPALGLRGVRLSLKEHHLLKGQVRALLRASAYGRIRLLIPFVTSVNDMREVKAIVEECRDELTREGHAFAKDIPIGCMIEVPSAALIADLLAPEVQFFSIGTNDLVQYTLAADRNNEAVAEQYSPLHPAVLRLIERTARAAQAAQVEISICGEMAGEPLNVPVLVGCRFDSFSMNPVSIPTVKELVCQANALDCRALLQELLTYPTVQDIEERVRRYHKTHLHGVLDDFAPIF